MKFHFIFKENGNSACSEATQRLSIVFAKYGSIRPYKGIIIFTSNESFLDNAENKALDYADNLERDIFTTMQKENDLELISLD